MADIPNNADALWEEAPNQPGETGYLRALLVAAGLKQYEAAEKAGVSAGAVSRWLNGSVPIPEDKLALLMLECKKTNPFWIQKRENAFRGLLRVRKERAGDEIWNHRQHFGDTVRALRTVAGLYADQVAEQFGMGGTTYLKRELGQVLISPEHLATLFEKAQVSSRRWATRHEAQIRSEYTDAIALQSVAIDPDELWEDATSFGAYMRAVRLKAGMTQEEVAAVIGVNRSLLSPWEHDTCFPKPHEFDFFLKEMTTRLPEWFTPAKQAKIKDFIQQPWLDEANRLWEAAQNTGGKVRAIRTACGLSIPEFAAEAGMKFSTYRDREHVGNGVFSAGDIDRIIAVERARAPRWLTDEKADSMRKSIHNRDFVPEVLDIPDAEHKRVLTVEADVVWSKAIHTADPKVALSGMIHAMRLSTGLTRKKLGITGHFSPTKYGRMEDGKEPLPIWLPQKLVPLVKQMHPEWYTAHKELLFEMAIKARRLEEADALLQAADTPLALMTAMRVASHLNGYDFAEKLGVAKWDYLLKEQGKKSFTEEELFRAVAILCEMNPQWMTDQRATQMRLAAKVFVEAEEKTRDGLLPSIKMEVQPSAKKDLSSSVLPSLPDPEPYVAGASQDHIPLPSQHSTVSASEPFEVKESPADQVVKSPSPPRNAEKPLIRKNHRIIPDEAEIPVRLSDSPPLSRFGAEDVAEDTNYASIPPSFAPKPKRRYVNPITEAYRQNLIEEQRQTDAWIASVRDNEAQEGAARKALAAKRKDEAATRLREIEGRIYEMAGVTGGWSRREQAECMGLLMEGVDCKWRGLGLEYSETQRLYDIRQAARTKGLTTKLTPERLTVLNALPEMITDDELQVLKVYVAAQATSRELKEIWEKSAPYLPLSQAETEIAANRAMMADKDVQKKEADKKRHRRKK